MRRAASAYALPNNAVRASRRLWRTVDTIWHAAGDTGGGFGYYTKRGLLAAVYSSTLLFWLDDRSEDFEDSWAFLERRIDDVMRIGKVRGGIENALDGLAALNPLRRH